ncbi:MAG: hypothetical protein HYV60_15910 [Planctomycetia bacterium]|nr:hypothetical protein [Planctomycetia bacterium]
MCSVLAHASGYNGIGQVHAALSYYFDHRDDILEGIHQDDAFVAHMRTKFGPGPLERKRMVVDNLSDDALPSG